MGISAAGLRIIFVLFVRRSLVSVYLFPRPSRRYYIPGDQYHTVSVLKACFEMGNCSSQPKKKPTRRRPQGVQLANIGQPQNVQIHIPRNRLDEQGVPLQSVSREVDEVTLRQGLGIVSDFIAQRGQHISVIAVGGAVNLLYLKSRATTHDVDIFSSNFGNQARVLLDDAMHEAQRRLPALGTDWLNTETQMWMRGNMHAELTRAAEEQDVRVFDGVGLRIYAAPWEYAFSAKINRLLHPQGQARSYDLADAVVYIHRYISAHGNQPVKVATAMNWARHYHHDCDEDILLNRVSPRHLQHYHRHAFVR